MCLAIEVEVVCVVMWLNFMFVNFILKMQIFKIRIILRFKKKKSIKWESTSALHLRKSIGLSLSLTNLNTLKSCLRHLKATFNV